MPTPATLADAIDAAGAELDAADADRREADARFRAAHARLSALVEIRDDGFSSFAAAVSDPGPDEPIEMVVRRLTDPAIGGWTVSYIRSIADVYGDTALRIIDRHRIGPEDVTMYDRHGDDVRIHAHGRWWTLADAPREVSDGR